MEGETAWLGGLAALGGTVASTLAMASGVALLATVFTADHEPTGAVWAPLVFHTASSSSDVAGAPLLGAGLASRQVVRDEPDPPM